MSQNNKRQPDPAPAAGLSFAFPLRLPERGTGAGGNEKPTARKSWARAKTSTRQNLPRR